MNRYKLNSPLLENVMTWSYLILRAIPAIHEINDLREVLHSKAEKKIIHP